MHKLVSSRNLYADNRILNKYLVVFILFLFLGNFNSKAQEYDEFPIELRVKELGFTEIPVAIKNQEAYISVTDLGSNHIIGELKNYAYNLVSL
ncbi:hypothetical protein [Gillisia sp. JM1]|uniref:hypothetical protein n=1 Tax=Gillisia sp. JM1 TaxID=1283286 RepID=UPI000413BE44|nr:hypothetical protein [Gillisia sp. JM1]